MSLILVSLIISGCAATVSNTKKETLVNINKLPETTLNYTELPGKADMSGYSLLKDDNPAYSQLDLNEFADKYDNKALNDGVYYFGFESCPYCQQAVPVLNYALKEKNTYAFIAYNEGICYWKLNNYEKAYKFLCEAIKYIDSIKDDINKGKIYHAYALICIKLGHSEAEGYIEKAFQCQKDNPILVATSKGDYGEAYFTAGNRKKAISEIEEGIKLFPKHSKEKYVEFLSECINVFLSNKEYEKAYDLSDESLDLAIETDNIRLIEKAYSLKGKVLQKENRYRESERYMNLALDSLFKFGTKKERHDRYLEMANMYYKLGEVRDAIKYFTLAMSKEKSI